MNNSIQPAAIQAALEEGAFEFWFQPKVSFSTGKVSGAEALIRWRRKDGCVLPASAWLPVAQKNNMMQDIAMVMFPQLCSDIAAICAETEGLTVAFNMEAGDLEDTDIVDRLLDAVDIGLLDPARIQIELTETALPRDGNTMENHIRRLTSTGISLAMDDYGTGFSSLDTLRKLPFSTVKIDQGVVMTLQESSKSSAIVLSSIRMAYEMGLTVVAEGVESEEIFDVLQQAGCSEAQGYWISKALPLPKFLRFAQSGKQWQSSPIGQLRHVEIDHLLWCKDVLAMVFGDGCGKLELESLVEVSDHQGCRLGQWLNRTEGFFGSMPEFGGLAAPHAEVHRAAFLLISSARSGASVGALQEQARAFNQVSEQLMQALQTVEIQVLIAGLNGSFSPTA